MYLCMSLSNVSSYLVDTDETVLSHVVTYEMVRMNVYTHTHTYTYVRISICTLMAKSLATRAPFFTPARYFPLCLGAWQPPAPTLACYSLHPQRAPSISTGLFQPFESGRQPTTPLDSARSGESNGAIGEPPRCAVTKLCRIKDYT